MSIGSNIKMIRLEKGLSIKELAEMADVTTSLISQIEHDKANPSINTLLAISTALNTDIRLFFQGYTPDEPAAVVRPKDRVCVGNLGTYNCLSPGASTRKVPEINNPHQEGYEFCYVIHGKVKATIEKTVYILEAGDAITYDASKKHVLSNASQGDTELISVLIPGMKQEPPLNRTAKTGKGLSPLPVFYPFCPQDRTSPKLHTPPAFSSPPSRPKTHGAAPLLI